MNNAKHTPGPWYVNGERIGLSEYAICAESRGTGFGSSVAIATQRDGEKPLPHEEAKANARLIVAAPELLALAKRLVDHGLSTSLVNDARAVIAKATGGDHE